MTNTVQDNKVVLFKYTLRNSEGAELDTSGDESMPYLHGASNIVPGLEEAMSGKKVGESFNVVIPPENGYGMRQEDAVHEAPRDAFPDDIEVKPGMQFALEGPDGSAVPIFITQVSDQTVQFDTNHPLAGQQLHFDIEITGVREPTSEELDHGHPHGPEGQSAHH